MAVGRVIQKVRCRLLTSESTYIESQPDRNCKIIITLTNSIHVVIALE